jgi:hypothetical protein
MDVRRVGGQAAVIAIGVKSHAVIMAVRGEEVEALVTAIGDRADEFDIAGMLALDPGVYVWEGDVVLEPEEWAPGRIVWCPIAWQGQWRVASPEDLTAFGLPMSEPLAVGR